MNTVNAMATECLKNYRYIMDFGFRNKLKDKIKELYNNITLTLAYREVALNLLDF